MVHYVSLKDLPIILLLCFHEIAQCLTLSVGPETYTEDSRRFIQFTCWENLYSRVQLLCWYQIKGSKEKLLAVIQNDDDYFWSQRREVVLYKTLDQSDNGTEIFCAMQTVNTDGSFSTNKTSQKIPINFQRNIQSLERPYVIVEPSTDIIIYDEHAELNFNCSGSIPVDNRAYNWYLQDRNLKYTIVSNSSELIFGETRTVNRLTLHMKEYHHQNHLFCAQDYNINLKITTITSKILRYGDLATSNMIRLIHRSQGDDSSESPLVTPNQFLDNNTRIQFTCYGFLRDGELLSWYQVKGSDTILLRMSQLQNPKYEAGQWIYLYINKTLMYSDNGTNLYCAKQTVTPDGNFSKGLESQWIPIMFDREIEPSKTPFVTAQPKDTTVYFDANTTLYFNCSGSEPVDSRNYTWYIKDPNSTLTIPLDQKYDASTNQNSLSLPLDESYHGYQLFCVQEYSLYIEHVRGSWTKTYGELARSNTITLIQWDKVKTQHLIKTILLPYVLPLLLVVLMVTTTVLVVVVIRRRCNLERPNVEDKDDIYTYTYAGRVTYANLDLPSSTAAYATSLRSEMTPYVNIVGVFNPKQGPPKQGD